MKYVYGDHFKLINPEDVKLIINPEVVSPDSLYNYFLPPDVHVRTYHSSVPYIELFVSDLRFG